MEITVQNSQRRKIDKRRTTAVVRKLLRAEKQPETVEVSILFTDDPSIQDLNRRYLGHDRPTDVLAFSQREGEVPGPQKGDLLGDVVVSVDTAARQAEERGKDLENELDLLVAHGVLHLLGYDDGTPEQAEAMQTRVKEVLGEEVAR